MVSHQREGHLHFPINGPSGGWIALSAAPLPTWARQPEQHGVAVPPRDWHVSIPRSEGSCSAAGVQAWRTHSGELDFFRT